MLRKESDDYEIEDNYTPPSWLIQCLGLAADYSAYLDDDGTHQDQDFMRRCGDLAVVGKTVSKLRTEHERVGFEPRSLEDQLAGLSSGIGMSLSSVISSLECKDPHPASMRSIEKLATLACAIGINRREVKNHLRIGYAIELGYPRVTMSVVNQRSNSPRMNRLDECEHALIRIESEYDAKNWRELRQLLDEAMAVYDDLENDQI